MKVRILVDFNLAVVKADCQTTKFNSPPDFLYGIQMHACEIFAIIITPVVYPGISGYTATMAPYGCLLHSIPIWRFVGSSVITCV